MPLMSINLMSYESGYKPESEYQPSHKVHIKAQRWDS